MIPVKLILSGFLSYRDTIEIDFTTFELACISGHNGAGKSSLLDAVTWALFGEARKRDDSLINAQSNTAEVRLDFRYENNLYRIQRSKPRDKTAQLEFFVQTADGGWKPLTEKSLRETENAIQSTLRMNYETFTNASFFLQGKADQFAQQRPGDRKRILSSILGLEVWEEYQKRAAERRKTLESEVSTLDARLEDIQTELSEEMQRKDRLKELEGQLKTLSKSRLAQETVLKNMQRLEASLKEQGRLVESLGQHLRSIQQKQAELSQRLETRRVERSQLEVTLERAGETEAAYQQWQKARKELEKWEGIAAQFRESEKQRSAPLVEIETAHAVLEQEKNDLLSQQESVNTLEKEIPSLQEQLAQANEAQLAAQAQLERRTAAEAELRSLHVDQAGAIAENPRLKGEMEELKARIDQLSQADGALCPLCGQPLSPDERKTLLDNLASQGKTLGDRYRQNQQLLKNFEKQVHSLESEVASLNPAEAGLRQQQRLADNLTHRAEQIELIRQTWKSTDLPRLKEVQRSLEENRFAPEARKQLKKIDAGLKKIGYDATAHDAVRQAELAGRASEAALRAVESARAALVPLEREIADLNDQEAALVVEHARQQEEYAQAEAAYQSSAAQLPDLDQAERELMTLQESENRLRYEVGGARQKVQVLDDLRLRKTELDDKRAAAALQIGRFKSLERAFSKDGVPALLIEQALPEIENQANELLGRLSGGNMSIRFATQRDYKDKNRDDKKETLDIQISDSAGTRDYEMFSGGEAFRVNFAIRLALSQVLARRAGARLQVLVIDEGFGSQDAEGRQRLVEAIHLIQGDFAKILVITHLEELKDYFPNRIEVEKTERGSTVRVI